MEKITSESEGDFLVRYKNDTFDLRRFLHKHPGGIGTLSALRNRDLTQIMSKDPVHSEAAFYLMKEYKVRVDENNNNNENSFKDDNNIFPKVEPLRYTTPNAGQHPQDKNAALNGLRGDKEFKIRDKADSLTPVSEAVTTAADGSDCDEDRLEVCTYCEKCGQDEKSLLPPAIQSIDKLKPIDSKSGVHAHK